MGIGISFNRRPGVVGTDRIPSIAMTADVLRQYPGTDMGIDAGIKETLAIDAVGGKHSQPAAIDLHMPEIFRPIPVPVSRQRITT